MAIAGAAKRYAQAAFAVAKQHGAIDLWAENLHLLVGTLQDPAVREFFASPAVPQEAKQTALQQLLPDTEQQLVRNFALLLLERRRIEQLPQIVQAFDDLVLRERGVAIAEVTAAVELSPAELQEVTRHLSRLLDKTVEVRPRVDPEIIGGLIARVGDVLIDGSVRTQLTTLRRQLAS